MANEEGRAMPSELFLLWMKDLSPPAGLFCCSKCCRVSEKLKGDLWIAAILASVG